MKITAWTKNYVVVRYNFHDSTWRAVTIPCTLMQAKRFISVLKTNPRFDTKQPSIVTLEEFDGLYTREKLWNAQA